MAQVDQKASERLQVADTLSQYGVEFRYPGDFTPLSKDQGEQALRIAEQTRDLILSALKAYLDASHSGGH